MWRFLEMRRRRATLRQMEIGGASAVAEDLIMRRGPGTLISAGEDPEVLKRLDMTLHVMLDERAVAIDVYYVEFCLEWSRRNREPRAHTRRLRKILRWLRGWRQGDFVGAVSIVARGRVYQFYFDLVRDEVELL